MINERYKSMFFIYLQHETLSTHIPRKTSAYNQYLCLIKIVFSSSDLNCNHFMTHCLWNTMSCSSKTWTHSPLERILIGQHLLS